MTSGSVPYPADVDPVALESLAQAVDERSRSMADIADRLLTVASSADRTWHGSAATSFVNHVTARAASFDAAAPLLARAAGLLRQYASALRDNRAAHERSVEREAILRRSGSRSDWVAFEIAEQRAVVQHLERLGRRFGGRLSEVGFHLDAGPTRSFIAMGTHLRVSDRRGALTGRDLIADAISATEDGRVLPDEIQIRELSDGSYLVIMPGVTDLSTLGGLLAHNPYSTVRTTENALPSVTMPVGAENRYADMVKLAMERAGIPAGANVTLVGHSYGSYTAMDLVNDDDFNSADGDAGGYHVDIDRAVAVAADVDWKAQRRYTPAETDLMIFNSRDDLVYQAEAQLDPEADWLWRSDRPLRGATSGPLPMPRTPIVTSPTRHPNQIEFEVNAGARPTADDKMSGHHPDNYRRYLDRVSVRSPIAPIIDGTGDARVVRTYNLRVPASVPDPPD